MFTVNEEVGAVEPGFIIPATVRVNTVAGIVAVPNPFSSTEDPLD